MAGAFATLMLGGWPEPFGLVAIESMATGTPVVARRAGAYTETVRHGRTGFLVNDVEEAVLAVDRVAGLDRSAIVAHARTVFSADRMVDNYLAAYEVVAGGHRSPAPATFDTTVAAHGRASRPDTKPDPASGRWTRAAIAER